MSDIELIIKDQKIGEMTVPGVSYLMAELKKQFAPNATDAELEMFRLLAQANNLDPAKREIYFVKYGNKANYVTGYQVYLTRAAQSKLLDGWDVVVGEKAGKPESATITIYRKDMSKPIVWHVLASEFNSGQANWMKMPTFMLKKVAMGQGFRLAFPEYLSGMPYLAEEISNNVEPGTPIIPEQPAASSAKRGKATKARTVVTPEPVEAEVVEPEPEPEQEVPEQAAAKSAPVTAKTAAAPVPEGMDPPPPEVLADDDQEKIVQHFRKIGITEEGLEEVLEAERGTWTTSHRTYLQGCWFKLTDTDSAKKMEVAVFLEQRYSQQSPF